MDYMQAFRGLSTCDLSDACDARQLPKLQKENC